MKKLLTAFIFLFFVMGLSYCNNNPPDDGGLKPNYLPSDSVKVKDTTIVDSAQLRKTGK